MGGGETITVRNRRWQNFAREDTRRRRKNRGRSRLFRSRDLGPARLRFFPAASGPRRQILSPRCSRYVVPVVGPKSPCLMLWGRSQPVSGYAVASRSETPRSRPDIALRFSSLWGKYRDGSQAHSTDSFEAAIRDFHFRIRGMADERLSRRAVGEISREDIKARMVASTALLHSPFLVAPASADIFLVHGHRFIP